MKTQMLRLLTIALLLASCGPTPLPATTEAAAATEKPTSTPTPFPATPLPTVSPAPTSNRSAILTLVENAVEARPFASDEYAPASVGLAIFTGGAARTGDDGRARLDLSPDATIIRLAPNTIFTMSELKEEPSGPFSKLKLFIGQIYIILSGGELQVETPSGLASVRGSMMGVSYAPDSASMTVTCLEGHCRLQNNEAIMELVAGQAADIRNGIISRGPRLITDTELGDWLDFSPELKDYPDLLPTLRERIDNRPKLPRPPRLP